MLLNLGGTLVSSHAAFYPLLPHGNLLLPRLAPFSGLNLTQHRGIMSSGISSRRRMRSNSAPSGPRSLHPSGSGPEGVPSTLFKFQPRSTKQYRQEPSSGGGSGDGSAATTIESEGSLHAGLIDESDLPEVSALLVRVRSASTSFSVLCLGSAGDAWMKAPHAAASPGYAHQSTAVRCTLLTSKAAALGSKSKKQCLLRVFAGVTCHVPHCCSYSRYCCFPAATGLSPRSYRNRPTAHIMLTSWTPA